MFDAEGLFSGIGEGVLAAEENGGEREVQREHGEEKKV